MDDMVKIRVMNAIKVEIIVYNSVFWINMWLCHIVCVHCYTCIRSVVRSLTVSRCHVLCTQWHTYPCYYFYLTAELVATTTPHTDSVFFSFFSVCFENRVDELTCGELVMNGKLLLPPCMCVCESVRFKWCDGGQRIFRSMWLWIRSPNIEYTTSARWTL